jgi:hypothetical protein
MYGGEIDNTYISLAWKLGLHPTILAGLSSTITSNLKKWVPNWPLHHQEDYVFHKLVINRRTICIVKRLTTNILYLLEN